MWKEGLFVRVFKGYIYHYNYQTCNYKCFFQGSGVYAQMANLLDNPNWDANFLIITSKLILCYLIHSLQEK